eukprot:2155481-Karenia_brevis.AAC.1
MRPSQLARRVDSGSVWRRCKRSNAQGGFAARRDQLQGGHISLRERYAAAAYGADAIDETLREGLLLDVISCRAA